eukprot:s1249_g2.t1
MNSSCCDRCFPRRCGLLGAVLLLLGAELLWLAVPMPKLCGKAWADCVHQNVQDHHGEGGGHAMMAGKVHEQVESIFPNLRLRVRDLCHAVRRLGSRPTFADGYLKETFLDFDSARFSAFVKELSGWSCKSLSAAKHRFESLRTPVARIALHFEAEVIMFERRTKKEGKICEHFLENVTVEHALTIACLSDAFDEHMEVTRFCDQEHFDLVALNGKLSGPVKASQ